MRAMRVGPSAFMGISAAFPLTPSFSIKIFRGFTKKSCSSGEIFVS